MIESFKSRQHMVEVIMFYLSKIIISKVHDFLRSAKTFDWSDWQSEQGVSTFEALQTFPRIFYCMR
jgi:hypothetical protein